VLDLLGRQRRACGVAPGRVADQRGEIADLKYYLMTQILQLAHFVQHHGVTDVYIRRGRVQAEFDAQRLPRALVALQLLDPFIPGQQFFATAQRHSQCLLNVCR